jgi:hypothetical protein
MPTCMRIGLAGNLSTHTTNFPLNDSGSAYYQSTAIPMPYAQFMLNDPGVVNPELCQYVAITGAEYQALLKTVNEPFDYTLGSQFFVFGIVGVLGMYLTSYAIGLVVGFVRSHG